MNMKRVAAVFSAALLASRNGYAGNGPEQSSSGRFRA